MLQGWIRRCWTFAMLSEPFQISSIPRLPRGYGEDQIRTRCTALYLGDHEVLCRCLGRFKMFLDSCDVGFAPHIIMDGFWEYWITQFVAARMKEGAVVLDIGANFGYYTLLMSELIGPSGKCIAFEPNPEVAAKLRKTVSINGFDSRTTIYEVALGSDPHGEIAFLIPHGEPKNARVVKDQGGSSGDAVGRVITVPQANADTICANLQRLDFVKIDAEGAEANIIDGMAVLIARFKPDILLEFNAGREYDARALVSCLSAVYGPPSYVDFNGQLQPIAIDRLETENVGQDWMLYFAR